MIQVQKMSLNYGEQTVFDNISLLISQTDRIGLIGRNGSGKTTFLKALQNPSILDRGTVTIQKNKRIAYLPQEVVLLSDRSILDETFTTFAELHQLQQECLQLEAALITQPQDLNLIDRYTTVQEEILNYNPNYLLAKTKKILMGLGFAEAIFNQPVSSLSVGWKMRIVLAKLLLQEADFYLFDEPTNHLDLVAKEWFLEFIQASSFGFVLICHERYFLDELCDKILDLEFGNATWYTGNYSEFESQKRHNAQLLEAAYVQQQKEIKQKQQVIDKFKAGTRASVAQSMQKALDKLERIQIPPSSKVVGFSFPPVQAAGKQVIKVEQLSQKFDTKTTFQNVSFEVDRGHKIAIIAPNGVGKTTLFNVITGALPIQHGTVTFGYNVKCAIFAQDQNQALNLKQSIIDNLRDLCANVPEPRIRSFLGAFLFSGADVEKKVGVLSGGEKNRVGMINVLLQNANLLLLDEPTNHLDIPSKEILLKALKEFSGTLLFVSHDRDFINDLATDIIELTPTGVHYYHGNYDAYIYHKQCLERAAQAQAHPNDSGHQSDPASANKPTLKAGPAGGSQQLKALENKLQKLDQQIKAINSSFSDLDYGTPEFDTALKKLELLQTELAEVEKTWEKWQK